MRCSIGGQPCDAVQRGSHVIQYRGAAIQGGSHVMQYRGAAA